MFFMFYLIVNLYMFMSVFLAVVYNTYKTNLKRVVKESVFLKRKLLSQAFDLMKETDKDRVREDSFLHVMKIVMPKRTDEYFKTLWLILDHSGSHYFQEYNSNQDLKKLKDYMFLTCQFVSIIVRLLAS